MNEALKAVAKSLLELSEAVTKLTEVHPEGPEVIRIEDVRKVLAGISQRGKTSKMKELLSKFGAVKLSDIETSKYSELIMVAKEIADALCACTFFYLSLRETNSLSAVLNSRKRNRGGRYLI